MIVLPASRYFTEVSDQLSHVGTTSSCHVETECLSRSELGHSRNVQSAYQYKTEVSDQLFYVGTTLSCHVVWEGMVLSEADHATKV
jgi:hypothetical protein